MDIKKIESKAKELEKQADIVIAKNKLLIRLME